MSYQNKFKKFWAPSCVVFILLSVGCKSSTWSSKNITGKAETALTGPFASVAPTNAIATDEAAANSAMAGKQNTPSSLQKQAATPQEIMADVRELGKVNPAAQTALIKELEKVEPDLWPSVVRNFRSRLAYGDRLYQEEMLAANNKETISENFQHANRNPYYAGQPIPGNGASSPSNGLQPGFYPPANNPAGGMSQPSPQQPTVYPQPHRPTNYSSPVPMPNSPSQPTMPSPYTSSKPTDRRVIPASYEEEYQTDERSAVKQVIDAMDPEADSEASMEVPKPLDWEDSLAASIETLQAKLEMAYASESIDNTISDTDLRADQLRLRFMLLAAGRGTEAVEPIEGMSEAMTDFWAGQMFGMNDLLDERKASSPSLRNASAKRKLNEALYHLGKVASLEVRNLSFCKAVNGFASIEQFPKYEFKTGSQVILYAELDNLKHEESAEGYRTSLEIGYEIFDSTDRRVEPSQPNASEECSIILRRDYYVSQLIRLPENLYPGRYVLKLKVEDKLGQKYGESIIEFEVK